MLRRNAVFSSNARTARKSRSAAPGTFAACHVVPPSRVLKYVPPLPLAHATLAFTVLIPRSDAVVPLSCTTHAGDAGDCALAHATALQINTTILILHHFTE